MRVKDACDSRFMPAYHTSGVRDPSMITLLVLHDTEGGSAAGVAQYFRSPSSGGSAHLVIDDSSCYRCLANGVIPWGAPGANTQGFHIEQCGYASWSRLTWMRHIGMLRRVAFKLAVHARKFNLPLRYVTADMLRADPHTRGVTTHAAITKSGIGGAAGTHTDPGSGYPIYFVLWLARRYLKGLS